MVSRIAQGVKNINVKSLATNFGTKLARGFGNPVSAGVMTAMEPTPANSDENEFARQAKYGAKATPASGRTGAGMNKTMNRVSSTVTSKPSPTPAAARTPTANKAGFYKGGSMGDTTVKRGDTLSGIAKRTGQSVSDLAKMNNISDVNKISAGAKLMTKVPTPPSRPADVSSAPTSAPKPETPAPSTRVLKTSPASNSGEVADSVARGGWMDPNSVKNAPLADRAWIGDKSVGLKPEKTPGATFSPAAAPQTTTAKPAEPEFKGRMIPPAESGVGASSPAASFVGAKKDMRSGGPATPPLTSKDFGRQPPASMQESVQVGANKYRIV